MEYSHKELRQEMVDVCLESLHEGMFTGTSGNLSVALEDGTMLITPTSVRYTVMRPMDIVRCDLDGNIIEAAQSMGATPMQIICKVMIPESVPSLIQNVTIALTTILGYSAMSGIIGGGGLGKIAIDYGYYRYKYLVMLVAVVILILLVQVFQSLGTWLGKKCDKRLKH